MNATLADQGVHLSEQLLSEKIEREQILLSAYRSVDLRGKFVTLYVADGAGPHGVYLVAKTVFEVSLPAAHRLLRDLKAALR